MSLNTFSLLEGFRIINFENKATVYGQIIDTEDIEIISEDEIKENFPYKDEWDCYIVEIDIEKIGELEKAEKEEFNFHDRILYRGIHGIFLNYFKIFDNGEIIGVIRANPNMGNNEDRIKEIFETLNIIEINEKRLMVKFYVSKIEKVEVFLDETLYISDDEEFDEEEFDEAYAE